MEGIADSSGKLPSVTPPASEHERPYSQQRTGPVMDAEDSSLRPSPSDIGIGIGLYFKYCHRQPIWLFEREEVRNYDAVPDELACSVLALTLRFLEKQDQMQLYRESAKTLVMLRVANGTVELTTIESLCLLAYSSFMGMSFPCILTARVPFLLRVYRRQL